MNNFDVIIIGGGPAGIGSLLWCNSVGLGAVLLEQADELGGQLLQMFHRVIDYPGLLPESGRDLRDHFQSQMDELQLTYRLGCQVEKINLRERNLLCNGERLTARAMVLATGAHNRRLGIPGEDTFTIQTGISFSATRDHSLYAGKKVCVVGGGDSAVQNALILSRVCPHVTLIHRSDRFRARAEWLAQAKATPNISFLPHAETKTIEGNDHVERLIVEYKQTGELKVIETEGVFIRIGIAPNTESFRGQLELDKQDYIKTDRHQQTSVEGVYAAGDVCRPVSLSVATAVGHAAIAVKEIALRLKG
jgi:thioredoxin reductase (NADPH)